MSESREPAPGLIGDTHRIANALETLVDLAMIALPSLLLKAGSYYSSGMPQRLEDMQARIDAQRYDVYDPRVPSVKAEHDDDA